jgi:hypothetical protein
LTLISDQLLSILAFNFNLRRYSQGGLALANKTMIRTVGGLRYYSLLDHGGVLPVHIRGLHSSTFRLNVNALCGTRWVHGFPPV